MPASTFSVALPRDSSTTPYFLRLRSHFSKFLRFWRSPSVPFINDYLLMAQKKIQRKHFLLSAGAALVGIVGLGRLSGSKETTSAATNESIAGHRVQRDSRSVPVSREVV